MQQPESGLVGAGRRKKRGKRGQVDDVFKKDNFVYQVLLCVHYAWCVLCGLYPEISSNLSGLQEAAAQYHCML